MSLPSVNNNSSSAAAATEVCAHRKIGDSIADVSKAIGRVALAVIVFLPLLTVSGFLGGLVIGSGASPCLLNSTLTGFQNVYKWVKDPAKFNMTESILKMLNI